MLSIDICVLALSVFLALKMLNQNLIIWIVIAVFIICKDKLKYKVVFSCYVWVLESIKEMKKNFKKTICLYLDMMEKGNKYTHTEATFGS